MAVRLMSASAAHQAYVEIYSPYAQHTHLGTCTQAWPRVDATTALAWGPTSRRCVWECAGRLDARSPDATLVGLLFDVPVYYIHEAFRDIIEMPPTPIGWDYDTCIS